MELHLYQIVVAAIATIMIYQGLANFIKGKQSQTLLKLFTRILVWGSMATIAVFPKITNVIAKTIGIEGNINAVILTGFILIFLMIFKLLSAIERLEQQITEVTREKALENLENETK